MSDHKRAGLHRAFSPSGLSGSNIHLAWCIPGLETLMWFVGKSRWQVHGSTLLTDSAGASGRVHNNTKCLSPPPSLVCLTIPHTSISASTCTYFLFPISLLQQDNCSRNYLGCSALCVLQFLVFQSLLSLFMSRSLCLPQISTVLLHYTHSYWPHTCTYPLTLLHHPLARIHSINHSPHSRFFTSSALLHILALSIHSRIGNVVSCPSTRVQNDVMHRK